MAINRGVLKGVGRREEAGGVVKGPMRIKMSGSNTVYYTTVMGTGWNTTGYPTPGPGAADRSSLTGLVIDGILDTADPTSPTFSPNGTLLAVNDYLGSPIFSIPYAGGPTVFGDKLSAGPGVFGPWIQFDPTNGVPMLTMPAYSSSTSYTNMHFFAYNGGGNNPPTATTLPGVTAAVGDMAFNKGGTSVAGRAYMCTVAGTPGTWTPAF